MTKTLEDNYWNKKQLYSIKNGFSRVDTDVELEVVYSCNICDVSDSLTCPDIQSS